MSIGPAVPQDVSVVYESFDGNRFEQFQYDRPRTNSIESSSRHDRDGSGESVRVNLRRNDREVHGSRRAELQLDAGAGEFKIGEQAWIGFSVFVPEGYETDPSFEIILQMHSFPDEHLGEEWRSPPISLKIQNGAFHLHHQYDRRAVTRNNTPEEKIRQNLGPVVDGVWTDFAININYQQDESGFIRLYQNGRQVYSYRGPVGYNDVDGMFTKFGIYKPDWKYNPERSTTTERTLYFDAFRFARGDVGLAAVDPATIYGANPSSPNISLATDSISTNEDSPTRFNVLDNDTIEDPNAAVTQVTQAEHGTVVFQADGSMTYTPVADFNGTDRFTYTVTAGNVSKTESVNVVVQSTADTVGDQLTVKEDSQGSVNVLNNDRFESSDARLSAVTQGANGSVSFEPDGRVTYTPNADFHGTDRFTYTVRSGGREETAIVEVTVQPAVTIQSIDTDRLVVNTLKDEADGSVTDGDISLRDALAAVADGGTITFAKGLANKTLKLTQQLSVNKNLTIDAGSRNLTLAGDRSNLLEIDSAKVTVKGLQFNGGRDAVALKGTGAGLNLTGVTISNSRDDAISIRRARDARLLLNDTTIRNAKNNGVEVHYSSGTQIVAEGSAISGSARDGIEIRRSEGVKVELRNSQVSNSGEDNIDLQQSHAARIELNNTAADNARNTGIKTGGSRNLKLILTNGSSIKNAKRRSVGVFWNSHNADIHLDGATVSSQQGQAIQVRSSDNLKLLLTNGTDIRSPGRPTISVKGSDTSVVEKIAKPVNLGGDLSSMQSSIRVGLFDSGSDRPIAILGQDNSILASSIKGRPLTIAAFVPNDSMLSGQVDSMRLNLNQGQVVRKENSEPYSLFGDFDGGNFHGGSIPTGQNTIQLDLFSKNNLQGELLATVNHRFTIINDVA